MPGRDTIARKAKGDGINPGGVDAFRTVSFDEWLRLFLHVRTAFPAISEQGHSHIPKYTFLLTRRDQYNLAQEVLRHILYSSAYQSRLAQDSIRLALISECNTGLGSNIFH